MPGNFRVWHESIISYSCCTLGKQVVILDGLTSGHCSNLCAEECKYNQSLLLTLKVREAPAVNI